jgi:ubiquinone/menaquinone biosynthesis C-methylase UbiE
MNPTDVTLIADECTRIADEYRRRETEVESGLYAPWQPAEILMVSERKRVTAILMQRLGVFPQSGDKCLEIGYGQIGWLADLISWGVSERELHGIELDSRRAQVARDRLPLADLRVGDATELPWAKDTFRFVILSTVFSSISNERVRIRIAEEVDRVMIPGGSLIWYDLAINNPKNRNVRKVSRNRLRELFPGFDMTTKSVTLAPPIARAVASRSFAAATLLSSLPFLRTHLLGLLTKK